MCEYIVFERYCNQRSYPRNFRYKPYKVLRRLQRPCFASVERMIAKNKPVRGYGDGITCSDADIEGFNFSWM